MLYTTNKLYHSYIMTKEYLQDKFANLLEFKRIEQGYSYQEMANFLDVSYLQLHRWVKKKTMPRHSAVQACCAKCGIDYLTFIDSSTNCLTPITLDSVCSLYHNSDNADVMLKAFLTCCSLLYKELTVVYKIPTNLVVTAITDKELQDLSSFDSHAILISPSLGQFLLVPCINSINFKFSVPDTMDTSAVSVGFEAFSTSSLSRIIELQKLRFSENG